jgi:hypothetical protein
VPNGTLDFELTAARQKEELAAVSKAIDHRESEFLGKRHVIGFGLSVLADKPVVRFYVDKKVRLSRLSTKDRIPRWLVVQGRRIKTQVMAIGKTPRLTSTTLGDPTDNDKNYHVDGAGTWRMGTKISVFVGGGVTSQSLPVGSGTSGCLVKQTQGGGGPWMMSCAHVLFQDQADVAQQEEDRDRTVSPTKLHNFVGGVLTLSTDKFVDAGLVECEGASKEILNISGAPKSPQTDCIYPGVYVQKSGATTGVTWSKIGDVMLRMKFENELFPASSTLRHQTLRGVFQIDNSCPQQPPNPGAVTVAGAVGKFGWSGDSGSLIVVGKTDAPGTFNNPGEGLQKAYDRATPAHQAEIVAEFDKAALGLLVGADETLAYGQDIELALKAFTLSPLEVIV